MRDAACRVTRAVDEEHPAGSVLALDAWTADGEDRQVGIEHEQETPGKAALLVRRPGVNTQPRRYHPRLPWQPMPYPHLGAGAFLTGFPRHWQRRPAVLIASSSGRACLCEIKVTSPVWLLYPGQTMDTSSLVSLTGPGYEVCVEIDLTAKVAAFCRELGDNTLQEMARQQNKEAVYERAEESLKADRIGPELEADLDLLDEMVRRVAGQGLYPAATRSYQPLPDPGTGTGAQWWTCPGSRCAGRGRVKPGQESPVCAATGEQLVPGPLPE